MHLCSDARVLLAFEEAAVKMAGRGTANIDELSTREMQALGALCLAAFCGRFAIAHSSVEELIAHQVSLLAASCLPDWEQAGIRLSLGGRGDPIPEEIIPAVSPDLRDGFWWLVECTREIGYADMYGAPTDEPRRSLLQAMDVLKAHKVAVPEAASVKVQPRPLTDQWGEPAPQDAYRRVLDRCMALLWGRD